MTPPTGPTEPRIGLDCDVLLGTWPPRAQVAMDPATVRSQLARVGIDGAAVCSARGAWFDDIEGNTETLAVAAAEPGWHPVATINLRNALRCAAELDRVTAAGVRAVRLFGPNQGAGADFPGYRHVVEQAVQRGLLLLVEGDFRLIWRTFAGRNARAIFLDVHAYHLADFILMAREEPGFVASTRLLNAPDSIETVVGDVGPTHLAFGSRLPLHAPSPATIRLRRARISAADRSAVAGGTLAALLRSESA